MSLIGAAAKDMIPLLEKLIEPIINRIQRTGYQLSQNTDNIGDSECFMGLLCDSISQIIKKLSGSAKPYLKTIMDLMKHVLELNQQSIKVEAAQVCINVASVLKHEFAPYLDFTINIIISGLRDTSDEDTVITVIGCISDLYHNCRSLLSKSPYTDSIINWFLSYLNQNQTTNDIITVIVGCIGDIAINIYGANFEKYLSSIMNVFSKIHYNAELCDLSKR